MKTLTELPIDKEITTATRDHAPIEGCGQGAPFFSRDGMLHGGKGNKDDLRERGVTFNPTKANQKY